MSQTRSPTPENVIHERETEWLNRQKARTEKMKRRQEKLKETQGENTWSYDGKQFFYFLFVVYIKIL